MRHPRDGDVTVTAFPARFSESPAGVRRLWPALGEHTEEVLREVGCDEATVRRITAKAE
jgi:crotonobetainyl-CoA:carnitine CoA-transferase CaiB-like acyl-CoA transferase